MSKIMQIYKKMLSYVGNLRVDDTLASN